MLNLTVTNQRFSSLSRTQRSPVRKIGVKNSNHKICEIKLGGRGHYVVISSIQLHESLVKQWPIKGKHWCTWFCIMTGIETNVCGSPLLPLASTLLMDTNYGMFLSLSRVTSNVAFKLFHSMVEVQLKLSC